MLLIPGCEVSTRAGHITGLFLDRPLEPLPHLPPPEEAVAAIRRAGGLAVLAHPCARPGARPEEFAFDLDGLTASRRPRELEQLAYTFTISNVTLSGVTHLVRHRMQSIVVPSIQSVDHSRVILPDTVASGPALERYQRAVEDAHSRLLQLRQRPALAKYHYYFALSGNLMDIMTTMNARELQWFIRLRSCNRAQWEVRDIAVELLRQLRHSFPALFDRFGPSCFADGRCPEGRLTCGQMSEVVQRFKHLEA